MTIGSLLDGSEALLTLTGGLADSAPEGATMLALALGRTCAAKGVSLDGVLQIVRVAAKSSDLRGDLRSAFRTTEEEPLRG